MKKNRGIHQVLSMLLCCVMLLGLLPMTALAATKIEAIYAGIDVPTAGEKFDFTAEGSCEEYTVGNVSWYHLSTGERMSTTSVAQAGQTYEVRIAIQTKSGYTIDGNTVGLINRIQCVYDSPYLRTSYTVSEPPKQIDSVELELDVPVPGAKPDFSAVCGDSSYTLSKYFDDGDSYNYTENGVQWIDATTKKVMDADDTFTAGHTYQAFIHLKKNGNYEFYYDYGKVPPVAVTAYGAKSVRTAKAYERDPFTEIDIICDFACDYQTVSSVSVTGLDAPKDGKAPDYSATLSGNGYAFKTTSASNPFVVSGVSWTDETAGNDLTATAKFAAGHTYTATVYLVPVAGYQFTGSVSGKINGNTATITGNGSEIQVKYTFPALATNQITSVAIEGVTAPAQGKAPSYVAIVKGEGYSLKARNDAYYKNGICWSIMESSDLPVSGGKFEGGKQYQIMMYLVAEEGYEFAATAGGALQVKATLNGKPVLPEILGNKKEIVVTYYFTDATDEAVITSAAVTGIDAPVIGAAPDYTADIADNRYALEGSNGVREKNGITWINNKTGNAMVVGADKFEAGVSYSVVVGVTAKDGYAFQTDLLNAPQITGSINGELVEVSGQDEYNAYLMYTFEALAEKKTLSSIAITTAPDKTEYKTGDTFDPTGMVVTATYADKSTAAVTGYTFTPNGKLATNNGSVTISYTEGNVTKTATQTIKVTQAKTPASLAVTTAPAKTSYIAGESFSSAGMVVSVTYSDKSTAAITGYTVTPGILTADTNSVTISYTENEKTVYATQTVTVEAAINPFSDIKESDYFHDPVLWAVSNGVTNGTSATTFSPHMTCSQAHILTFLWRAVGSPEPTIASPYSNAAVKSDQYFYKAFVWAWEKGLISNTAHDPNAPCSRSDVVTYLWKLDGSPKTGSSNFTDVPASASYAQAVAWAVQNGVTNGTSATTFSPDATCTRGQIVTFLWRYMSI